MQLKTEYSCIEWEALKLIVFERDDNACVRCNTKHRLSVHHIKPRAEGGLNILVNLITLCNMCHDIVELDSTELFVRMRARQAQRTYYNRNRGIFVKSIELPKIKLQHKTSIIALYLKAHPLTDKECKLRKTSSNFCQWLKTEAYKYYKTLG